VLYGAIIILILKITYLLYQGLYAVKQKYILLKSINK